MKQFLSLLILRILILQMLFLGESMACRMAWVPRNNLPRKLISFNTCQALEEHIKKNNTEESRSFGKGSRGGKYDKKMLSLSRSNEASDGAFAAEPEALTQAAPARERKQEVGEKAKDIVGTNNQVATVDEADFVKFNGSHIFQLHKGSLKILKAWPANEMNILSSMKVEGSPEEMLVNETNAVVLANTGSHLVASIFNVSNPESPVLETRFDIPGTYKTARLIDNTLRIVNFENMYMGAMFTTRVVPETTWFAQSQPQKSLNIKPTVQVTGDRKQEIDASEACRNIWVPEKAYVSVLTRLIRIDLGRKKYDETLAFINPETVYAAEKNIYVAANGYDSTDRLNNPQQTSIHKFSLKDGQAAQYQATGVVSGALINQFAMDEFENNLRVATYGTEKDEKGLWSTVSRVKILKQKSRELATVGQSEDMGKGERLYSVRFDGDKGYAVTFRQVDPLYTLDLSNPKKPRVMGELKIPGFSSYIHTLDSTHLLTIGQDADPETGRTLGMKLSVFDVSDMRKPREVKSLLFKKEVYSEATYQHKAFSFYRKKGILAIPATTNTESSAILLFKVSQEDIQFSGELDMTDMFAQINQMSTVRRSFFADDVVYAIGENGVRVASLERPQKPLSTVHYEKTMAQVSW